MKRKGFMVLAVLVLIAGAFGLAHSNSGYWADFKAAYSTSPLTNPPLTNSAGQNCLVCHAGWPTTTARGSTINAFANAYIDNSYVFDATLEGLDSDGDGYTNGQEIAAGSFPGNAASIPSAADTTAPNVTAFTIPATAISLTVAISTFTATDTVGVTGYMATESSTAPLSSASGWTATAPAGYTFASAGGKTLYGWAKDAAGNVSAPGSAPTTITLPDTIAPTVDTFTIPPTATSLTVLITAFSASDAVGVTGYMVTSNSTIPAVSAGGWSSTAPASYAFATPGAKTLYGWAKDAAGNVSAPASAPTTITLPDTIAPTVDTFTIPPTATSLTVLITAFSASDAVGVTGYMVTSNSTIPAVSAGGWSSTPPVSYTYASAGIQTLYAWAKDAAGNVSVPVSADTTITLPDTTPPVVTSFIIPSTSSSLTVAFTTFDATDDSGAVAAYFLNETGTAPLASDVGWLTTKPTSYTCSSAGTETLYAWAKDAAGNVSEGVSAGVTITLSDTTPPVVTSFTIPSTSSSLTVAFTTFDATDDSGAVAAYFLNETGTAPLASDVGWLTTKPTSYTCSSAGTETLYAWAKDAAGNVSEGVSATITISVSDTTRPVITSFKVPSRPSSRIVPITLTATDDEGVAGYLVTEKSKKPRATDLGWRTTAPTSYTFGSGGYKALYAWAKDAVGNISARASLTIVVPSGRTYNDEERSDDGSRDD